MIVASAPVVTITVAVLVMLPLVAMTVFVNVPGVEAAVNTPVALIVPPPVTTDHVGLMATDAPEKSIPTAVNCCVPFAAMVFGLGETLIEETVPGLLIPCTSHAVANNPAQAIATITRAMRAFRTAARIARLLTKPFIMF